MRNLLIIILIIGAISTPAQSQYLRKVFKEMEVIGGFGTTNYFGDIGGQDSKIVGLQGFFDQLDIDLWQTRMMLVTGVRVAPIKQATLSFQIAPTWISGSDLRSDQASRGYEFSTFITEFSLQAEYYLSHAMNPLTGLSPYLIGGIGGSYYAFRNNRSEARSKYYPSYITILGIGTRLPAKPPFSHSIDIAYHFAGTDFMDGYKSDKNSKDLYFVISYKASLQFFSSWFYDYRGLVR